MEVKDCRFLRRCIDFSNYLEKEAAKYRIKELKKQHVILLMILKDVPGWVTISRLAWASNILHTYVLKRCCKLEADGLAEKIGHAIPTQARFRITEKGTKFLKSLEDRIRRSRTRPRIEQLIAKAKEDQLKTA